MTEENIRCYNFLEPDVLKGELEAVPEA